MTTLSLLLSLILSIIAIDIAAWPLFRRELEKGPTILCAFFVMWYTFTGFFIADHVLIGFAQVIPYITWIP